MQGKRLPFCCALNPLTSPSLGTLSHPPPTSCLYWLLPMSSEPCSNFSHLKYTWTLKRTLPLLILSLNLLQLLLLPVHLTKGKLRGRPPPPKRCFFTSRSLLNHSIWLLSSGLPRACSLQTRPPFLVKSTCILHSTFYMASRQANAANRELLSEMLNWFLNCHLLIGF